MENYEPVTELLLELKNINSILDSSKLFKVNPVILFCNRRVLCENILNYFNLPYEDKYRKKLRDFTDIYITIEFLQEQSNSHEAVKNC
jgi:hypothetical protein